ncbi:hypothetical protein [Mycoplasma hafezii]|uniref:hypothetical protein n=1 Tax=Mycoplasma hafezii TaxID=525886 RepID=UPI003CF99782
MEKLKNLFILKNRYLFVWYSLLFTLITFNILAATITLYYTIKSTSITQNLLFYILMSILLAFLICLVFIIIFNLKKIQNNQITMFSFVKEFLINLARVENWTNKELYQEIINTQIWRKRILFPLYISATFVLELFLFNVFNMIFTFIVNTKILNYVGITITCIMFVLDLIILILILIKANRFKSKLLNCDDLISTNQTHQIKDNLKSQGVLNNYAKNKGKIVWNLLNISIITIIEIILIFTLIYTNYLYISISILIPIAICILLLGYIPLGVYNFSKLEMGNKNTNEFNASLNFRESKYLSATRYVYFNFSNDLKQTKTLNELKIKSNIKIKKYLLSSIFTLIITYLIFIIWFMVLQNGFASFEIFIILMLGLPFIMIVLGYIIISTNIENQFLATQNKILNKYTKN